MSATRSLAWRLHSVTGREIRLFLQAFSLGVTAQKVARGTPIEEIIEILTSRKRLPGNLDDQEAVRAATRAGRRLETFGQLNTCLIRSLIAGALLSDRNDLNLRLGVQPGESPGESISGHAWLTLGNRILPNPDDALAPNGEPYLVMASFPLRRPS